MHERRPNARMSWLWMCYQVNSYTAELHGVLLWKNDLDVFWKKFYSPFHAIRDTGPRMERAWAWVLTEARGYCTYMHSACQFGSWVPSPRVPGPGVPSPWVHWIFRHPPSAQHFLLWICKVNAISSNKGTSQLPISCIGFPEFKVVEIKLGWEKCDYRYAACSNHVFSYYHALLWYT